MHEIAPAGTTMRARESRGAAKSAEARPGEASFEAFAGIDPLAEIDREAAAREDGAASAIAAAPAVASAHAPAAAPAIAPAPAQAPAPERATRPDSPVATALPLAKVVSEPAAKIVEGAVEKAEETPAPPPAKSPDAVSPPATQTAFANFALPMAEKKALKTESRSVDGRSEPGPFGMEDSPGQPAVSAEPPPPFATDRLQAAPTAAVAPPPHVVQDETRAEGGADLAAAELEATAAAADRPTDVRAPAPGQTSAERAAPQAILRQIGEAIATAEGDRIEIQLDPPELGRVRISLATGEHGLSAAIMAERPEALDLMRRNAEQLASELSRLGHQNVDLSFEQGGRDDGGRRGAGGETGDASSEETAPRAIRSRVHAGGMDIRY